MSNAIADRLNPDRLIEQACELAGSDDFGDADEPERGTHRDEMGVVGIGVDRQFGAQCADPVEQAQAFEEFALVTGVGGDLGGQVVEDLPDETPGFQGLLCVHVLPHF